MGLELVRLIHDGHAFYGLELTDHVHVLHQTIFQRAASGQNLTQSVNAVGTQVRLVNQLCSADGCGIERLNALVDTLDYRHSPAVLGLRLLEWQCVTFHADNAAVVNLPRGIPCWLVTTL
ncbi:hypothetical protein MS6204_00051 [Escherichia coli]|nr:hypothetical protein [Escherichia coli]